MKSVAFNLVPFTLNLSAGGILLNQCRNIAFVLLCTVVLNACGYRFAGQGAYPKGVEKILIEVFENRTSKVGIERVVTNQVVFEFTRQREKSLTSRAEDADAILKGVIRTISTQTIARVGTEVASQREVVMTVDLKLVQLDGEQVLWAAKGISDRQAYDVVEGSNIATDQNENVAIARLSERISQRIFSRLTNNF
jgi:outer membrane lipopolysaccharide assembly protein LptE/RlpB